MAEPIVVVESRRDWKGAAPAVRLVIADEYLSDPAFAEAELHVINLCRSMRYQSLGYYCSLLAEARGFGANDFKIPLTRRTLVSVLTELTQEASA